MIPTMDQKPAQPISWEQRLLKNAGKPKSSLKPEYQELKFTLHRKLLDKINLEALATIDNQRVRGEVRSALISLIDSEPTLLSALEKQQICEEVLDEVFGLGPLEPLLQDPTISFDYKRIMECFDSQDGKFSFEKAARAFQIIEDTTETVIIPYNGETRRLIEELKYTQYPSSTLRKLQPYTVSIYEGEFDKLSSKGVILTIDDTYHVLNPDCLQEYYDLNRGLLVPESGGDGLFF